MYVWLDRDTPATKTITVTHHIKKPSNLAKADGSVILAVIVERNERWQLCDEHYREAVHHRFALRNARYRAKREREEPSTMRMF